jgi:hypothetical protein
VIKQYEGNGIYKVIFTSTGREYELYDSELREICDYNMDLEEKYELVKMRLALTTRRILELEKTLKEYEGRLL